MAYMRLFLQDAYGEFPSSVCANFDAVPRVGSIVQVPGRPAILVKAVRPALPPREDDETGVPAHIYAVAMSESVAPMAGFPIADFEDRSPIPIAA